MQNLSILEAQVESLKELIEVMEMTNPDMLIKKWRQKVFEELVRNKQQHIMHVLEIKKFKEEEKRMRSREQQIKTALESAHMQASSLSLERAKLQKEIQNLQSKVRSSAVNSSNILNIQSLMTSNLELNTRILAMLDTFNHRIAFSMSKIKTAKILHTREIYGLRNKLIEGNTDQKKLAEEIEKYKIIDSERETLSFEVAKLSEEVSFITEQFKSAENNAKVILIQTNEKYKSCVDDLEAQLDEKVSENNRLFQNVEELNQRLVSSQECAASLENSLNSVIIENKQIKAELLHLANELENSNQTISERDETIKHNYDLLEKLKSDAESSEYENKEEISKLMIKISCQDSQIAEIELQITELTQAYSKTTEEDQGEINFLNNKVTKLEAQVREFRRERDILFENAKRAPSKPREEKTTQTDSAMKHSAILKTAVKSRIEDLEMISKGILDI